MQNTHAATPTFTFSDSGITATDAPADSYTISGTTLTINATGTYTLTGANITGGNVIVNATTGSSISTTLILDDLTLTSTSATPILIEDASATSGAGISTIVLDGDSTIISKAEDRYAIAADGDLTIDGDGTLDIKSKGDGIYADSLTIEDGVININAEGGCGIVAEDELELLGGNTEVFASSSNADAAYYLGDADFTVNRATTIGVGRKDEVSTPTTGVYLEFGTAEDPIEIPEGTVITIKSSTNMHIYETTAPRYADSVIFSSPDLVKGEEYNLYVGGILEDTVIAEGEAVPKKTPEIYPPKALTLDYTGKSQELVTEGYTSGGTLKYAISTSASAAPTDGWSINVPEGYAPGEYYIWYRVVGDDEYEDIAPRYVGTPSIINMNSANVIAVNEALGIAEIKDDVAGRNVLVSIDVINVGNVYRLYNPNTGEHLFTRDANEMTTLTRQGWKREAAGDYRTANARLNSTIPMYRLYNPLNPETHFYTTDVREAIALKKIGWKYEGIAYYVYKLTADEGKIQYRLYNPYSYFHHFTTEQNEVKTLVTSGWNYEGEAYKVN